MEPDNCQEVYDKFQNASWFAFLRFSKSSRFSEYEHLSQDHKAASAIDSLMLILSTAWIWLLAAHLSDIIVVPGKISWCTIGMRVNADLSGTVYRMQFRSSWHTLLNSHCCSKTRPAWFLRWKRDFRPFPPLSWDHELLQWPKWISILWSWWWLDNETGACFTKRISE